MTYRVTDVCAARIARIDRYQQVITHFEYERLTAR